MNRKIKIKKKVERAFQCLDEIENIECSPFFYTRLQSKIKGLNYKRKHWYDTLSDKFAFRPAFLAVVVLVNIISAVAVLKNGDDQSGSRVELISEISEEYSLNQYYYDDYIKTDR